MRICYSPPFWCYHDFIEWCYHGFAHGRNRTRKCSLQRCHSCLEKNRKTEYIYISAINGPSLPLKPLEHRARFFCLFSGREHAWGELRSAELSTSLQISVFLFLCELSSPWASSRNDRWSWANWEGVSRTLSKAELCNNGPYLDARTDRISPHTSLLPSHTLPHPQKDPLSRISTSRSSQSLDQSSMICRQVVESNYCLLCDVIYPTSLAQASFKKIM